MANHRFLGRRRPKARRFKSTKKRVFRKRTAKPTLRRPLGRKAANIATGTETFTDTITVSNANPVLPQIFSPSQLTRFALVRPAYRFYRIVKLEYIYEAEFDQFNEKASTAGPWAGNPLPFMYTLMARDNTQEYNTLAQLQTAGVKPRRFDRNIKMTYKPNLLTALNYVNAEATSPGPFAVTPTFNRWLPTYSAGPVTVDGNVNLNYFGHIISFENVPDGTIITRKVKATWELKQPQLVLPE